MPRFARAPRRQSPSARQAERRFYAAVMRPALLSWRARVVAESRAAATLQRVWRGRRVRVRVRAWEAARLVAVVRLQALVRGRNVRRVVIRERRRVRLRRVLNEERETREMALEDVESRVQVRARQAGWRDPGAAAASE